MTSSHEPMPAEHLVPLVTSPKNSGLSASLPVILAIGESTSGTTDADHQRAIDQALASGVQVTFERPLTPEERHELGLVPGKSFADALKEAMAAPAVIELGTIKDFR
ncbi:hypothetical protein [Arthrobacter sp. UYCo732]|uniref:hypothetical protein n=1 Tax=Arthrobacter sp. UYCo732 TaxID=3156336 RepID=UPI003398C79E